MSAIAGSDQLKSAWNSASITSAEHDDARDPVREHGVDAVGPSWRRLNGRPHGLAHHAVHALVARADDLEIEVAPVAQRGPPQRVRRIADGRGHADQLVRRRVVDRQQRPRGPRARGVAQPRQFAAHDGRQRRRRRARPAAAVSPAVGDVARGSSAHRRAPAQPVEPLRACARRWDDRHAQLGASAPRRSPGPASAPRRPC